MDVWIQSGQGALEGLQAIRVSGKTDLGGGEVKILMIQWVRKTNQRTSSEGKYGPSSTKRLKLKKWKRLGMATREQEG